MERTAAELESVDDDELESFAGGLEPYDESRVNEECWHDYTCESIGRNFDEDEHGHDIWCVTAWHCFAATLHSDTDEKCVTCFSNYYCVFVYCDLY